MVTGLLGSVFISSNSAVQPEKPITTTRNTLYSMLVFFIIRLFKPDRKRLKSDVQIEPDTSGRRLLATGKTLGITAFHIHLRIYVGMVLVHYGQVPAHHRQPEGLDKVVSQEVFWKAIAKSDFS